MSHLFWLFLLMKLCADMGDYHKAEQVVKELIGHLWLDKNLK